MALKTDFPTINSWTTQSSFWGGVWVVIAMSSLSNIQSKEDQTDLESSSVSHYDIGNFIQRSSSLSCNKKTDILQNCWKPTSSFTRKQQYDQQTFKTKDRNKVISFQPIWFDQRKWLYYRAHDDFKGGWCLSCVLFLTDVEKRTTGGALVRAPFRNYDKSKELLDDNEKRAFHKTSIERASCTQLQQTNLRELKQQDVVMRRR